MQRKLNPFQQLEVIGEARETVAELLRVTEEAARDLKLAAEKMKAAPENEGGIERVTSQVREEQG